MNDDAITRLVDAVEQLSLNLERIAEALESVDEKLGACISHTQKGSFLCVTGNIATY